jgi:MOSC domain-containing protein YiiM
MKCAFGASRPLRRRRGDTVPSAIVKERVTASYLYVGSLNLAGDDQADRSVHGGIDKAVYLYPREHYVAWQHDGFDLAPGDVGDNLVAAGALEQQVRIGSTWRWGEALIQVTQPRTPCFKLSLRVGRKDVGPRMVETMRCGWYLRALEPGAAPTDAPLVVEDAANGSATVADTLAVMLDPYGSDPRLVNQVLDDPALAQQSRDVLVARRDRSTAR